MIDFPDHWACNRTYWATPTHKMSAVGGCRRVSCFERTKEDRGLALLFP